MKQFAVLVVASVVLGTVLIGCDSKPTPQNAEERAMSEGRRTPPPPVAPPGPTEGSGLVSDNTAAPPDGE